VNVGSAACTRLRCMAVTLVTPSIATNPPQKQAPSCFTLAPEPKAQNLDPTPHKCCRCLTQASATAS
jgi:hypothetical protein